MSGKKQNEIWRVAVELAGGHPLDVCQHADGSLVVISQRGQKLRFQPDAVQAAIKSLKEDGRKTRKEAQG